MGNWLRTIAVKIAHCLPKRIKSNLKWKLTIPDMEASLCNMKRLGFEPRTVIDVGAYVGDWTRMCKRLFPDAHVMMCEPQPTKRSILERITEQLQNVQFEEVLLGAQDQAASEFFLYESGSSINAQWKSPSVNKVTLPMTTLDNITKKSRFARPDLIKIDVEGAEIEVLSGGLDVLSYAQAVILEVSLLDEYQGCPLFHNVVQFMLGHGFHVYDICTIWRNTPTQSMNQADVIFVRSDSPLFHRDNYNR